MSQNQTTQIRFSVEESVWFKKGQEVRELLSMSLDPEISVQEHNNYITIRGALVLTGDYHPQVSDEENEAEIYSLRDPVVVRTVDEIRSNEVGINSMKHRFPVDITIPTNRISHLDDVYVLIESFDYELLEHGRLELKADLSISGIVNEREAKPAALSIEHEYPALGTEANELPVIEASNVSEQNLEIVPVRDTIIPIENSTNNLQAKEVIEEEPPAFPSFTTEARKEPVSTEERNEQQPEVNLTSPTLSEEQPIEEQSIEIEQERAEEQVETQIPVNIMAKQNKPQAEVKERAAQNQSKFEWDPKSLYSSNATISNKSNSESAIQHEENSRSVSTRSENALYLTKMLANNGEDDFSRLKMRIIQSGDTIGTIAEQYDVSKTQIMRMNGLDDEPLKEGQILYIPVYAGVE